jgi:hypothetical protein
MRISNLSVVVAGQNIPDSTNIHWGDLCECLNLQPIEDDEAWYKFATDIDLPLEREAIKAIARLLKGKPLDITTAFDLLAKEWQK